ncbi:hypothetical protein NA57DRAFT_76958 [Rhizodiscina lignyota]|uniref:Uncharacterized protein n=1 Tax=Rhizodiscina lignyota TaxID=1504668 RepID=A0A9P4IAT3_9PEZI|nr:hypothetical protein NA57DRAFT_76958 [Rhizodiscina lignyota]
MSLSTVLRTSVPGFSAERSCHTAKCHVPLPGTTERHTCDTPFIQCNALGCDFKIARQCREHLNDRFEHLHKCSGASVIGANFFQSIVPKKEDEPNKQSRKRKTPPAPAVTEQATRKSESTVTLPCRRSPVDAPPAAHIPSPVDAPLAAHTPSPVDTSSADDTVATVEALSTTDPSPEGEAASAVPAPAPTKPRAPRKIKPARAPKARLVRRPAVKDPPPVVLLPLEERRRKAANLPPTFREAYRQAYGAPVPPPAPAAEPLLTQLPEYRNYIDYNRSTEPLPLSMVWNPPVARRQPGTVESEHFSSVPDGKGSWFFQGEVGA